MLWFKFIKFDSKTHVFHYKKGKIINEGVGLAFYASKRKSSIEAVTLGSRDIPFIFSESTSDFQTVSVQGQITYMIEDPKKIAGVLDFTVDLDGNKKTDDGQKLEQRLVNEAQTASTSFIQGLDLRSTITSAQTIQEKIFTGLSSSDTVNSLGIKIMSVNIIAVKPTPEMEKALETTTREKLQQEADQAIFDRRNFAVEQERIIKESELNTDIAVQEKQKQIALKIMEKEQMEQDNRKKIRVMKVDADIEIETKRKTLIKSQVENEKKLADSNRYKLQAQLEPYKDLDWKIISALSPNKSAQTDIAIAFRELAENAQNIQNLNITPDLLQSIVEQK